MACGQLALQRCGRALRLSVERWLLLQACSALLKMLVPRASASGKTLAKKQQ